MNTKQRTGKSYEKKIFAELMDKEFDVYETVVDDQGIDGIIRVQMEGGARHFDLQMKGAKNFAGIRCHISKLTKDMILLLYSRQNDQVLWLDYRTIVRYFGKKDGTWGGIFLKKKHISEFEKQGFFDLEKLKLHLGCD